MEDDKRPKGLKEPGTDIKPSLVTTAEAFYARLSEEDATVVRKVAEVIDSLATQYNQDGFVGGNGYLAVYAIGGNVTKPGKRPDVDLLVVEGVYFPESYFDYREDLGMTNSFERWQMVDRRRNEGYNGDWVAGELQEWFERNGYQAQLIEEMPDDYDEGANPKGLLRLTPDGEGAEKSPIDIVIAKAVTAMGIGEPRTLADFEARDVDATGNPLPRVLLSKRENLGKVKELHW
jgi:hypothetical protein